MNGWREVCVCDHDIATHYRDPASGQRWACTGMRCECKHYIDALKPTSPPDLKTPKIPQAFEGFDGIEAWLP